jgi:drug/metabolite transporter (DMT)-like permease
MAPPAGLPARPAAAAAAASPLRTHGVLCLSQAILIVHAFVVKHALESAAPAAPATPAAPAAPAAASASDRSDRLRSDRSDAAVLDAIDAISAAPLAFAALRACISAPILLAFFYARQRSSTAGGGDNSTHKTALSQSASSSSSSARFVGAALCGFFGVFLYPLLYILGMQATTPTAACVCEALTPVFSLGLEFLWPRVAPSSSSSSSSSSSLPQWSARRALAVLLAVGGSIAMTVYGAWREQGAAMALGSVTGRLTGNLLVTASAFAYALFLTVQRRTIVTLKTSVMYTTAWGNVFGAVLLVLTALAMGALRFSVLSTFGAGFWTSMVWAALVTSVVGYSLEGLANAWSSPTLVAVYNAVQPFGAGLLSHRVADGRHATNAIEMGCAAMVASGVLLLKTDAGGEGKVSVAGKKMKQVIMEGVLGGEVGNGNARMRRGGRGGYTV